MAQSGLLAGCYCGYRACCIRKREGKGVVDAGSGLWFCCGDHQTMAAAEQQVRTREELNVQFLKVCEAEGVSHGHVHPREGYGRGASGSPLA
jgi:hypothetical protein